MKCSSTYFTFLYYKKNLSMLPLNLVATTCISVTGLINTSTGYSCYLINKENPQFIISFVSIGFNILSESDCIVKQTAVCSVCYTKEKKKEQVVYISLLNIDCFANSQDKSLFFNVFPLKVFVGLLDTAVM